MPNLESLLPAYREQYNALLPDIKRSVRSDLARRGMSNSGEATEAEARAEATLLAELAGKSATAQQSSEEAEKDRALKAMLEGENRKESRRAQNLGLISSGLNSAMTLAMLSRMNSAAAAPNIYSAGEGQFLTFDPKTGSMANVPVTGGGGGAPGATPPPQVPTSTAGSMWRGAKQAGAGLAGGLLGRSVAGALGGHGTGADVGAGIGGLAAPLAMLAGGKWTSPWQLGLGALLGSTGGGLLGGLFK